MIVVMGTIELAEGDIDRLQGAMAKQMAETQAEDGCQQYIFSRDVTNPNRLLISEHWRDGEALAAHGKTAHMAEFNKAIASATIKAISVKAYEVAGVRVLLGE